MADTVVDSKNILHTYEDVYETFATYIIKEDDRHLIERAYEFARQKHEGIFRKSGEPYIHHLIEVAYIVASLQSGPNTIAAAFLHDTVEDTDTTIEDIKKIFNEEVASIVDALTKIQRLKLSHRTDTDMDAEDHRKILLGMAKDIRVIIIKLADRLHNMRTLDSLSRERQIALSKETLEVFSPIAHRLGMFTIKSELEDLSLKYLEPEKFKEITAELNTKSKNRVKSLETLEKKIADTLFEKNIPVIKMESRVKSIYSIYKKIYVKNHPFDEIYDLLAIRIITETELNCYEILGLIHAKYKPLPGRFKDYIAMPKPNMYQSLHTCIFSGDGNIFEIQIRTQKMDEVAETGVAAHWRYKEGTNYNAKEEQKDIEEKLFWFRDFISVTDEAKNDSASDYINTLKHDVFESNVYVFTPLGKVIDLPAGSTPLDFAYKIHSRVGEQAVGALVNNVLVPLSKELKTGDVVEIKTSSTAPGPNEGWLKIAKSSSAQSKIKRFLQNKNEAEKEELIKKGKEMCLEAFKEVNIPEEKMMEYLDSSKVFDKYSLNNVETLFFKVATKNVLVQHLLEFLRLVQKKEEIKIVKTKKPIKSAVIVGNDTKIHTFLASCCSPIPGDRIVGYITKGKGISVHRDTCPNILDNPERQIEVSWNEDLQNANFPVSIIVSSATSNKIMTSVINLLSELNFTVSKMNTKTSKGVFYLYLTINIPNLTKLETIFQQIRNIPDVIEVKRKIN